MKLSDLQLHEEEFDVFVALSPSQKIAFIEDIHRNGEVEIEKYLQDMYNQHDMTFQFQEVVYGNDYMSVIQYGDVLRLNSSSLKLLRTFVKKLWMDGLIMTRINESKTEWDTRRYLRVYRLTSQIDAICEN